MLTGSRESGITSHGAGIYDLTADGGKLFLNAVNYMAQPVVQFTAITRNANGTITLEWEGGGTLQAAMSITGPWQDVAGATSPYTFTPEAPVMFGRIIK